MYEDAQEAFKKKKEIKCLVHGKDMTFCLNLQNRKCSTCGKAKIGKDPNQGYFSCYSGCYFCRNCAQKQWDPDFESDADVDEGASVHERVHTASVCVTEVDEKENELMKDQQNEEELMKVQVEELRMKVLQNLEESKAQQEQEGEEGAGYCQQQ